jgi:hypothetical protein
MENEILDIKEAAMLLRISPAMARMLAIKGDIPCTELGTGKKKRRIFMKQKLLEYLMGTGETATKTPTVLKQKTIEVDIDDQPSVGNPKKESQPIPSVDERSEIMRYKAQDLWEAGVLMVKGFELDEAHYDRLNNWWSFYFADSVDLRKVLADHYHAQLMVNSRLFSEEVYKLKGIMSRNRPY